MLDVGFGGPLGLQALVGKFYVCATSEDPGMDMGLRELRPGTEVNPALLSGWHKPSPTPKLFLLTSLELQG